MAIEVGGCPGNGKGLGRRNTLVSSKARRSCSVGKSLSARPSLGDLHQDRASVSAREPGFIAIASGERGGITFRSDLWQDGLQSCRDGSWVPDTRSLWHAASLVADPRRRRVSSFEAASSDWPQRDPRSAQITPARSAGPGWSNHSGSRRLVGRREGASISWDLGPGESGRPAGPRSAFGRHAPRSWRWLSLSLSSAPAPPTSPCGERSLLPQGPTPPPP